MGNCANTHLRPLNLIKTGLIKGNAVARCVMILTLLLAAGCSFTRPTSSPNCKMRAYIYRPLDELLNDISQNPQPLRIGIIPFTVPANLTAPIGSTTGLGHELAWRVQQILLEQEGAAIIEILNREDWPSKRSEFFPGNFGAISQAHESGYDVTVVGQLKELVSLNKAALLVKVIDVQKQVTISYLELETSVPNFLKKSRPPSFIGDQYDPSLYDANTLFTSLGTCAGERIWTAPADPMEAPKPWWKFW